MLNSYSLGIENEYTEIEKNASGINGKLYALNKVIVFYIDDDRFIDYESVRLVERENVFNSFKKSVSL